MKSALILAALTLSACGAASTNTGGIQQDHSVRCEQLLTQCNFNNNEKGCLAIKQTPEQGLADKNFFDAFCSN